MPKDFDKRLTDLENKIHARLRARAAHMSAGERRAYEQSLTPEHRSLFRAIVGGVSNAALQTQPSALSAYAAEMDARMGLAPDAPSVRREPSALVCSALGSTARRARVGRLQPSAAPTQTQLTVAPPSAAEMDARMGVASGAPHVRRGPGYLEISALGSAAQPTAASVPRARAAAPQPSTLSESAAEMDRAMGLDSTPAVTRTRTSLTCSALGVTAAGAGAGVAALALAFGPVDDDWPGSPKKTRRPKPASDRDAIGREVQS